MYAVNDSAFVAHTEAELQHLVDHFSSAADFGLAINASKTEVMYQPPPGAEYHDPNILLNGTPLPVTKSFTYLGSLVTNDTNLDTEVGRRIRAACVSFRNMKDRLLKRRGVKLSTKNAVYCAVTLPSLQLYSSGTYTLYRRHIRDFHGSIKDSFAPLWVYGGRTTFLMRKCYNALM